MTPKKGKPPMQIQEATAKVATMRGGEKFVSEYLPESPSVIDEVIEMAEQALRKAWKRASGQK
jgi:hypothetical protein